ncbi:MAG: GPR endopeptidase [Oscillospiraceae bacterium]
MLLRRTDLAVETLTPHVTLSGVTTRTRSRNGFAVTEVEISAETAAEKLGKPQGRYITIDLAPLTTREPEAFHNACNALAAELSVLLSLPKNAPVLVVGLGNPAITPDAVGPLALGKTLVTRHLVSQLPEHFGGFRPVSAAAGVLGTTGMESCEVTAALVAKTAPAAVIVVDALASRSVSRLCNTLQIADTGITPGSGVGNHRGTLNRETLGVPVIAIGVPTVVDGGTLALDLLEEAGRGDLDPTSLGGIGGDLFVTPRDIDVRVADAAKVIGYGISLALNPHLTVEDIAGFLE